MTKNINEYEQKIKDLEAIIASKDKQLSKRKSFGLNYEYKADEAARTLMTHVPVLKPRTDKSVIQDRANQTHTLIKGDNLPALVSLLPNYAGKVDVIYIDPPYNTGNNDFIYNDRYLNKEDSYRHSTWLSFMEDRLRLARRLLSDSGVIFVSIDDNEQAHLKLLMDSVFGEQNFISQFIWLNNLTGRQLSTSSPADTSEYILAYSKRRDSMDTPFLVEAETLKALMPDAYKGFSFVIKEDEKGSYFTTHELYNSNSKFNEITATSLVYDIYYNKATGDVKVEDVSDEHIYKAYAKIPPHSNSNPKFKYHANRWGRSKVLREKSDLEFVEQADGSYKVFTKRRDTRTTLKNILTNIDGRSGSVMAENIIGKGIFDHPKPMNLIKLLLTPFKEDITVLDFFAGSGTTGHAVAELNAEDGGTRKCVLITDAGKSNDNPDAIDIAESVTFERLKRVFTGKGWADGKEHPSMGQNLEMFEIVNIPTVGKEIDYKFTDDGRVLDFYIERAYNDIKIEAMVQEASGETVPENWTEPSKAERLIKIWRNAVKQIATNRHNDASLFAKNNQGEKLND